MQSTVSEDEDASSNENNHSEHGVDNTAGVERTHEVEKIASSDVESVCFDALYDCLAHA